MPDELAPGADDRDVRMFLVLAEELHYGRTAERLGVSASRVSQVVVRLERRVGGRLVERTSRRVELSALGERLRELATPAVRALDSAVTEVAQLAGGLHGVVRIGTYHPLYFGSALNRIVTTFEQEHPNASVAVRDIGFGGAVFGELRRHEIDVLTMRLPMAEPDLTVGPTLLIEPRVALLARDHPLAEHAELTWEQIGQYTVADNPLYPRLTMDALAPPRTPSGKLIDRRDITSTNDIVRYVSSGEAIHSTVEAMAAYMQHPNITYRPILGLPTTRAVLVWLNRRDGDPLIAALAAAAARVAPDESTAAGTESR